MSFWLERSTHSLQIGDVVPMQCWLSTSSDADTLTTILLAFGTSGQKFLAALSRHAVHCCGSLDCAQLMQLLMRAGPCCCTQGMQMLLLLKMMTMAHLCRAPVAGQAAVSQAVHAGVRFGMPRMAKLAASCCVLLTQARQPVRLALPPQDSQARADMPVQMDGRVNTPDTQPGK